MLDLPSDITMGLFCSGFQMVGSVLLWFSDGLLHGEKWFSGLAQSSRTLGRP